MGVLTALALATTVKTEVDAHKARKEERKFTKQAKADALKERTKNIDEQRLQMGLGGNAYATRRTTPGGGSFTNQTGEVLG